MKYTGQEQAGDEYVSFDINYVLDAFMESYSTAAGCAPRAVYIIWCWMRRREAVPVRISGKMEAEMDRIMDETWDYLKGVRSGSASGVACGRHPEETEG